MGEERIDLTADELAEYCRTRAAILVGHTDRLSAEIESLLDDIEADTARARESLDGAARSGTETPDQTETTGTAGTDPEAAVEEIESRQETVRSKQSRMDDFRSLADGYTELAARLVDEVTDGETALEAVLRFEIEHDAPTYFEPNTTIYEAVADRDEE